MTRYRVGYHCPVCPADHLTDDVIQSPDKGLDGHPLLDLYRGEESRPELAAILGTIRRCTNNQEKVAAPTLEQFFLEAAL